MDACVLSIKLFFTSIGVRAHPDSRAHHIFDKMVDAHCVGNGGGVSPTMVGWLRFIRVRLGYIQLYIQLREYVKPFSCISGQVCGWVTHMWMGRIDI